MNTQMSQNNRLDNMIELNQQSISELIEVGSWIHQQGWCPATSGNFSVRTTVEHSQETHCLITASGVHKGHLNEEQFVMTDLAGNVVGPNQDKKPSAETLVHLMLYRLSNDINSVLHIHSIPNTVLSQLAESKTLLIQGFEMQKSIENQKTHEDTVELAVLDNTQDMTILAEQLKERWIKEDGLVGGFLVRGHGAYFWGKNIQEAKRHLEGIEFILACMLELKRFGVTIRA